MRYRLTFAAGLALGYVLGARAGREQYEKIKKSARELAQNPALRNTAESCAQQSRDLAGRAYQTMSGRVGERVPDSVAERLRAVRSRHNGRPTADDWGSGTT
jgi:hypothetical protein